MLVTTTLLACCSLGAVLLSGSSSVSSASAHATSSEGRIVVMGDSLAVSPSHQASFPSLLEERLRESGLRWKVTNLGVKGDQTAGGMRRFDAALLPDTRILILELGVNDGLRGVDIATIEKNLSTMIERAQAKRIKVLLCGMLVPPHNGWNYMIAFNGVFPRLARKYNVPLVPFLLEGVALQADMNIADGVHPNAAGAKRIADTVWRFLQPLVESQESANGPMS